jgi:hypothetical protein
VRDEWGYFMGLLNGAAYGDRLSGKAGQILTDDNRLYLTVVMEAIKHKIDPDSDDPEFEADITAVIDELSGDYIQGMMLSLAMMLHRFHSDNVLSKEITNIYSALEVILMEKKIGGEL